MPNPKPSPLVILLQCSLYLLVNYGFCFSPWFQLCSLLTVDDKVEYFQDIVYYCSLLLNKSLCGSDRFWVVTIVMHIVLRKFLISNWDGIHVIVKFGENLL